jgi:hypothetical protein
MKLGCDPEVFCNNGNVIVPVCGYIPGTKLSPLPVSKGALQEDNVAAEFNIEPATTKEEWINNIFDVMGELSAHLSKHGIGYTIKASHYFERAALEEAGQKAFVFGCDPDLNAWTGKVQIAKSKGNLRTCGGHVHIEGGNDNTVRWMDVYVGLPSLLIDKDKDRRKMYGKPGSFRFKPYGVEYRAVSNFWLQSNELMGWIWDSAELALEQTELNSMMNDRRVYAAIMGNKPGLAIDLMREYGVNAPC